jgi:hypothetical protein
MLLGSVRVPRRPQRKTAMCWSLVPAFPAAILAVLNPRKISLTYSIGGCSPMFRLLLLLFPLTVAASAAKLTDYSADMVMLNNGLFMYATRLYVSGQRSRVEGMTAAPFGKIVSIVRKDRGISWTLFLDSKQYSEVALPAGRHFGKTDLANLDLTNMKKEDLGRETVLGYSCTKMRVTIGKLPNGQPMVATVWVADTLELALRLETMGTTQENRNLRVGPQPASLFEIPAGFTKTNAPAMLAEMRSQASARVPPASPSRSSAAAVRGDQPVPASRSRAPVAAWKANTNERQGGARASKFQLELNVNRVGKDYRGFVPARASAESCAEVCAKESRCGAWTWVKNELEPPTGHCWLKNPVPEPVKDDCCVSGVKK